jgi:hypothetical protein
MLVQRAVQGLRRARVLGTAKLVLVSASMLSMGLSAGGAWANEPFRFDLSLDVVGADLVDVDSLDRFQVELAGLPLSLGTIESTGGSNPGLKAGVTGGYTLPLGDGFAVVTSGSLQKTRYFDDTLLGADSGIGRMTFRFERHSFRSMLEPGIEIDFLDGELNARRYRLNGRVSHDVLLGLDVYLVSALMRREYMFLPDDNADSNHAQAGLNYSLGDLVELTFSYDLYHKWAAQAQSSTGSAGPAIGINLSPAEGLDIAAIYRYCPSYSHAPEDEAMQERVDTMQSLGINASWRNPRADYLTISADYGFERQDSYVDGAGGDSHDGMINMALQF